MDIRHLYDQELVDYIEDSKDFDLQEAVRINRGAWSDEKSERHRKFITLQAEPDILDFFEKNKKHIAGPLLDIGCAAGHNLVFFHQQGAAPLYGIDISLPFVTKAKRDAPYAGVVLGDMHSLPYGNGFFRTVVARGVFHATTTQGFLIALKEANRVLAHGGMLYLFMRDTPSPEEVGKVEHAGLYTFLRYSPVAESGAAAMPEMVRNFIPQAQLESLLQSCGFTIMDSSPRIVGPPRNYLSNRPGLSYHCRKFP